jgi:transcriptional regulator with XRE-family HTH domain
MEDAIHVGKAISRIRELRGMKQETLADYLGISQQAVSKIEQSGRIDELVLARIAEALGVSVEGLKHFTAESVFNNINNFHDQSIQNNFNPLEKVTQLYEQLLASEREKIEILKKNSDQSIEKS